MDVMGIRITPAKSLDSSMGLTRRFSVLYYAKGVLIFNWLGRKIHYYERFLFHLVFRHVDLFKVKGFNGLVNSYSKGSLYLRTYCCLQKLLHVMEMDSRQLLHASVNSDQNKVIHSQSIKD